VELTVDAITTTPSSHTMSRRTFFRRAGLGLGTLTVLGTGALAYRAHDQGVLETGHGPAYEPWRNWQDGGGVLPLVRAAILAPSPHNAQAWHFAIGDAHVDVFADRSRATGALDPFLRELHVGLGAALENIVLAARANGENPSLLLLPAGTGSDHVAHVALSPGPAEPSALAAQIPHRHTNRYPFVTDRMIPDAALRSMSELATPSGPEVRLVWLTSREQRGQLGELLVAATSAIIGDADQRASDARWFRQSWDEIQTKRDGITIDAAGLPDLTAAAAKLLPAQSPKATSEAWLEATRDRHTRTAAAYGIVAVRDTTDTVQQLQGGRLLQRVHLWATAHGIALHHMNQVTERADRERQLGLAPEFGHALATVMPPGWEALSTFRIGFPTHDAKRSPRRSVEDVMVR
jgi:hypothetical protein